MAAYLANGARLGWLIDPQQRRAYVYRAGEEVETLEKPRELSGAPELPGFVLDLEPIWPAV
jgi:Uma2 family endonuclease